MTNFTPGPWRYVGERMPLSTPQGRGINMHVVATNHPNGPWESIYCHIEGDARLCASAPTLLAQRDALLAAAEAVSAYFPPLDRINQAETRQMVEALRAAVLAAKGGA